jgi:DNA binding domain, excisionase family
MFPARITEKRYIDQEISGGYMMSNEIESSTAEKWVNLEDIADHLSVSTDTVRNWIKDGKLPFYKAGKRYKFKISEVDTWVRSGKITE